MSYLVQCDGFGLAGYNSVDDIMDSYSSNNESVLEECYIEELKSETMTKSQTTTTKLKKATRTVLPSFDAPVPAPRGGFSSGDSTSSSTASPLVPSLLPFSPSLASSQEGSRRKKKKTKRSVRFSHEQECFYVLPLRKYAKKEIKNCWYTKSELIKRYASLDLIEVRIEAKKEPKKNETFRGLEELDEEHRAKCEKRRSTVVQAVLDAQEEQLNEVGNDEVDPLFLAVASRALTVDSKTDALEKGMADMLEALSESNDVARKRQSLDTLQRPKMGTIVDPFCVPDRPRRYSAPASSLHQIASGKDDAEEIMEALKLFDDIDISVSSESPVPAVILTAETDKSKKRSSSPSKRHSLDSSSHHSRAKSKAKSSTHSSSSSSGKTKSNNVKSPKQPRRYSAPVSSLHETPSAKNGEYSTKETMEERPLFGDIDNCIPPAPQAPVAFVTPTIDKNRKRASSPSRPRSSLDSSSNHGKSKSKSKSPSASSSGKTKGDILRSLIMSPKSPAKKKAKASISNHVQASPKKKDSKSCSSSSKSPSLNDRQPSRTKLPFIPSVSNSPSSPASQVGPRSKQATNKKRLLMESPRSMSSSSSSSRNKKKHSALAKSPTGSHMTAGGMRIHAPTPPRQDPPGMFTRISSIRLEDQYPTMPRL